MKTFEVKDHAPSILPKGDWKLVWSDEFDGDTLDTTKWDYRLSMMGKRHPAWTDKGVTLDGNSNAVFTVLEENGSTPITTGIKLGELIRRPELNYDVLLPIDKDRPELDKYTREQVNIQIKYDGYIKKQIAQVEQFKKLEQKKIPKNHVHCHLDAPDYATSLLNDTPSLCYYQQFRLTHS